MEISSRIYFILIILSSCASRSAYFDTLVGQNIFRVTEHWEPHRLEVKLDDSATVYVYVEVDYTSNSYHSTGVSGRVRRAGNCSWTYNYFETDSLDIITHWEGVRTSQALDSSEVMKKYISLKSIKK